MSVQDLTNTTWIFNNTVLPISSSYSDTCPENAYTIVALSASSATVAMNIFGYSD